jgi:hypothetical protein
MLKEINVIEEKEIAPSRSWELYQQSLFSKILWLKEKHDVPPLVQDILQWVYTLNPVS